MVPHVISHKIIKKKQNHMVPHVISHKIITWCTWLPHKLICESQYTMTKLWNPTTQLTPLNNYLNNCVIATSYKPIVKKIELWELIWTCKKVWSSKVYYKYTYTPQNIYMGLCECIWQIFTLPHVNLKGSFVSM